MCEAERMQLGFQILTRAGRGENLILTVKWMSRVSQVIGSSALGKCCHSEVSSKKICHRIILLPDLLSEGLSQEQGGNVPSLQSHSSTGKKLVIKGIM